VKRSVRDWYRDLGAQVVPLLEDLGGSTTIGELTSYFKERVPVGDRSTLRAPSRELRSLRTGYGSSSVENRLYNILKVLEKDGLVRLSGEPKGWDSSNVRVTLVGDNSGLSFDSL